MGAADRRVLIVGGGLGGVSVARQIGADEARLVRFQRRLADRGVDIRWPRIEAY
ncbi:MAG: hypothetical protein PVG27_07360 [Chloroflexota bacterium]|jgi:hypothetical protein